MEVYDERGDIVCNKERVLEKLKSKHEKLYDNHVISQGNVEWDSYIKQCVYLAEPSMLDPLYTPNQSLKGAYSLHTLFLTLLNRFVIHRGYVK